LDLQDDEIELANEQFRAIYYKLIEELNANQNFSMNSFISELDQETISQVSSILMEEEKYTLHNWERKDIYPKDKGNGVAQLVSETILTLRCYLIKKRMFELQQQTENIEEDHKETIEEIMNYLNLNKLLNQKLNRVLS